MFWNNASLNDNKLFFVFCVDFLASKTSTGAMLSDIIYKKRWRCCQGSITTK
jgi:hypothetical protein